MYVLQNLIKSNLGPLLNNSDYIAYSRIREDLVECDVYAPYITSCACCKQLKDTFTSDVVSHILAVTLDGVEINCELPELYHSVISSDSENYTLLKSISK